MQLLDLQRTMDWMAEVHNPDVQKSKLLTLDALGFIKKILLFLQSNREFPLRKKKIQGGGWPAGEYVV